MLENLFLHLNLPRVRHSVSKHPIQQAIIELFRIINVELLHDPQEFVHLLSLDVGHYETTESLIQGSEVRWSRLIFEGDGPATMYELQISFTYDRGLIKILLEACEESGAVLLPSRDFGRPKLYPWLQLLLYEAEAFSFHSLLALEGIVLQALSIDLGDIDWAQFRVQELIGVLNQVKYDIEIRPGLYQVLDHRQWLSQHVDIFQPLVDLGDIALLPLELIDLQHLRQVVSL